MRSGCSYFWYDRISSSAHWRKRNQICMIFRKNELFLDLLNYGIIIDVEGTICNFMKIINKRSVGHTLDTPEASIAFTIILLFILTNGFFVLTETALNEARKGKLEKLAETGNRKAKLGLSLLEDPGKVLAGLQIGITLMGVSIGTFAGAKIAPLFSSYLHFVPYAAAYADATALVFSVSAVLYVTLVIGEFVPKKIALYYPEPIVIKFASLLNGLKKCSRPFVAFLSCSTNFTLLFFGITPHKANIVTEDEVRTLIEQGTEEGTFEKTEQDMVDRIFRLSDQNANALMTPRTQMLWLDLEDPLAYNLSVIKENPHMVFLIGRDNLDDFAGILYVKDLLNLVLEGNPPNQIDLEKCIRTPMFIPKSMHSFTILENFKTSGAQEAVVLDEFGGVIGFITVRDIITEVVGDIFSHQAPEPVQITKRDDSSWLIDGLLGIDEFKEHFALDELPEEERTHYQTMGGFITSYLGYIPTVAEKFKWGKFTFEIVDMDRVRIDKILVTKETESSREEENLAS